MRVEIIADDLAPNALRRWAAETPDQVALEHVDGRCRTYAEVLDHCERWASGLAGAGIETGTPVGVFVDDSMDGALAWLAVTFAGMVAVPLNTAHVGRMLHHVLATAEVRAVIASIALVPRFDGVCEGTPLERIVVLDAGRPGDVVDGVVTGDVVDVAWTGDVVDGVVTVPAISFLAGGVPVEPVRPELHDTAMFLLTSGTTGPSKAVVIPWAASHSHWSWVPGDMVERGDALYAPVSMFHNSGIGALQFTVWKGARLVMREKFSVTAFWDDIRRTGAVAAGIVGPMTAVLWAQPVRPDDADNTLRGLALGPMIEQMEAFERRFGTRVCTAYGMTEVPSMVCTGWDHGPWETCGTVDDGWPWPEVQLVDEHDRPVPTGAVGELIVRTRAPWALNAGYHGDPAATAAAWRNGWFHTGDAFRRDAEGHYFFVDRMKDSIRRRGENISSFEVEAAVLDHPAVAECAAFGVPDGFGGDEVMVAIVPAVPVAAVAAAAVAGAVDAAAAVGAVDAAGGAGVALDPAELFEFLGRTMPAYAVPRYVDVVESIPRNSTSLRVQKFVLRQRGVTPTTWDRTNPTW